MLNVKFKEDTYARFSAAAEILDARSIAALIHEVVLQKIREAEALTTPEDFARIVAEHKTRIAARSIKQRREIATRRPAATRIIPDGTTPAIPTGNERPAVQQPAQRKTRTS